MKYLVTSQYGLISMLSCDKQISSLEFKQRSYVIYLGNRINNDAQNLNDF